MKRKIIVGILIFIIVTGVLIANVLLSNKKNVFNIVDENVEMVVTESIQSVVEVAGVVETSELYNVYIDSQLEVKTILVCEKERVEEGQKLLELDLGPLDENIIRKGIEKRIKDLEVNQITTVHNQKVGMYEEQLEKTFFYVAEIKKKIERKNEEYTRYKELYKANAIAKTILDRIEEELEQLKFDLIIKENEYDSTKNAMEDLVYLHNIEMKTIELNQQLLESDIEILKQDKRIIEIKTISPIDGIIQRINVKEGMLVSMAGPCMTLINPEKQYITAQIQPNRAKDVMVGQKVIIEADSIEIEGTVERVSGIVEKDERSNSSNEFVEAIISFKNSDYHFILNSEVKCRIITAEKENTLVVSYGAVKESDDGTFYVYVLDKNNRTIRKQEVKVGIVTDFQFEITDGLSEDDLLLRSVPLELQDQTIVNYSGK